MATSSGLTQLGQHPKLFIQTQPVQLSCKQEMLEARVTQPSRSAFDKLTTVSGLREKLELLNEPFGQLEGRDSLRISTDELTPDAVAERIQAHL